MREPLPAEPAPQLILADEAAELLTRLEWVRDGHRCFVDAFDSIGEQALTQPSRLPGWTRGHVAAHVAMNARAIGNLATWARTGVETPMYASFEERAADIERAASLARAELRTLVTDSQQELEKSLSDLPDPAWLRKVRTAQGREVPGIDIPWLRAREVWVHAVDLDAGVSPRSLPLDFARALMSDVVSWRSTRPECPALHLVADDDLSTWRMGQPTEVSPVVRGPLRDILAWLLGRGRCPDPAHGAGAIELSKWL